MPSGSVCVDADLHGALLSGSRMSKRERNRQIREGVRALRRKPGWDPAAVLQRSPAEQLRDLEQSETTERSYDDAAGCEACHAERERTKDETALCRHHFARAMGLSTDG